MTENTVRIRLPEASPELYLRWMALLAPRGKDDGRQPVPRAARRECQRAHL
jgi:hypothetical protein